MPFKVSLMYGEQRISALLPETCSVSEAQPNRLPEIADLTQEVINGLRYPRGCPGLNSLAEGAKQIAVVISDHTRTLPSDRLLPILVAELESAGIRKKDITVIIGGGNHRPVTTEEKMGLMGPLYDVVKCIHNSETGYKFLGITSRGTPVEVCQQVADADLIISLGCIEMHQLAGYSGGVKGVAVGAASKRAIEHNHRLSRLGKNGTGIIEGNPVRQDMEEFASLIGAGFVINVVLNQYRQVVGIYSGDPVESHAAGCALTRRLCSVSVTAPADIVIVSPGGKPRDDTVYQAQKSVANALKAVAKGGIIIVTARCGEGFGDPVFEEWLRASAEPEELEERALKEFALGGHKAAFVVEAVKKAAIYWVSDMRHDDVRKLFFEPYDSLQDAVDSACNNKGNQAGVLIMPWGALTVPQ